jgi:O-antigen ligase
MRLVLYSCLFLIFIQCIDAESFNIPIPLIPFSLGETLFILLGLINLNIRKQRINSIIICLFIIYITTFLAAFIFINEDFYRNISRSLGVLILFIASIGWSNLWSKKEHLNAFNIFFLVNMIYWSVYLISITYVFGNIVSYGEIFSNDDSIINHHTVGLAISISSLYILIRFFIIKNQISILGYCLMIFTFILLILSESRSNLLIYIIILFLVFTYLKKSSFKAVFLFVLIAISMLFTFNYLFSDQISTSERFSLDSEYQTNTNTSRIEIYKIFPGEMLTYPLGKGAIKGTKMELFNGKKNPHNKYMTFSLQGGLLAFSATLFFLGRIIFLIWNGRLIINYNSKSISAGFIVAIAYWVTLLTIDLGGLLFQIILSLTIYLYDVVKLKKNKIMNLSTH